MIAEPEDQEKVQIFDKMISLKEDDKELSAGQFSKRVKGVIKEFESLHWDYSIVHFLKVINDIRGFKMDERFMNLKEFEDFHQRAWLRGFGDRSLSHGSGRIMGFYGEGKWACGGIWDTAFSYHNAEYAGIPATGKLMTIRDFDWWKREGEFLTENWVPIDLIDLCRQMGVDLFERLQVEIDHHKTRGW